MVCLHWRKVDDLEIISTIVHFRLVEKEGQLYQAMSRDSWYKKRRKKTCHDVQI